MAKTMLGINEACQRYHVSPATLRRAIKAGKLEGVRREKTGNGVWRIPNSSLKTLYKPRKGSTQEKNNKAENLPKINENQPEDITALRMQIEILQAKLEAAQDLARVQESILKANLLVSAEKMTVINADSDHSQEVVHDYSQPLSKAAPPAKQSRFMTMLRRLFDHGQG